MNSAVIGEDETVTLMRIEALLTRHEFFGDRSSGGRSFVMLLLKVNNLNYAFDFGLKVRFGACHSTDRQGSVRLRRSNTYLLASLRRLDEG